MKLSIYISYLFISLSIFFLGIPTSKQINNKRNLNNVHPFHPNPDNHSFGMRLRKLPGKISEVYAPVFVKPAPGNEATIVGLTHDSLRIFYINSPGAADRMMSITSADGGLTWGDPKMEFNLPHQGAHGNQVIKDHNGELHCVFLVQGEGKGGYRGRLSNIWYSHKKIEQKRGEWTTPKEIFHGYVGALRGFIQLKGGRLLLAFAKAVPEWEKVPPKGITDYGWNEIISLYSDDGGKVWKHSESGLKVVSEHGKATRYGGIEPAILELKNGKIWMLIRTNSAYLYESYSVDGGKSWQQPRPTKFISSNSPAAILRLRDNRIVIFWCSDQCWDNPHSYADGGRQVLHAAISNDDAKTWRGFREVLIKIEGNIPHHGDFGVSYSSAVETADGKIALISGQGAGKVIVLFDPDWLEQGSYRDNFSKGLIQWTMFGGDSVTKLLILPNMRDKKALLIRKSANKKDLNTEAVWNFPMASKGELILKIRKNMGSRGINVALSDHFSTCGDTMANKHAVFVFSVPGTNKTWEKSDNDMTIEISWSITSKKASLYLNNQLIKIANIQRHPNFGINYLRVGIPGDKEDLSGYYIKSVNSVTK